MKIKTSLLKEQSLDWAVAKAAGVSVGNAIQSHGHIETAWDKVTKWSNAYEIYAPTINWNQAGPIIEREKISVQTDDPWSAYFRDNLFKEDGSDYFSVGETPLVAAMRCFVASKLGEEVDIPEELL